MFLLQHFEAELCSLVTILVSDHNSQHIFGYGMMNYRPFISSRFNLFSLLIRCIIIIDSHIC
jgi:hypothetical protein